MSNPQFPNPSDNPDNQPPGMPYQPMGGYPTPEQSAPQATPPSVIRSFQLWIVSLVIGVISAVVGFLTFDSIRDDLIADMQEQMPDMSRDQIETVVTISNIASAGFYLALLGAILFLVFQMKAGKNWARITLTIVGGISVLLSLLAIAGGTVGSLIQLVSAGVIVAAIVFMYRADAAQYFQKRPQY